MVYGGLQPVQLPVVHFGNPVDESVRARFIVHAGAPMIQCDLGSADEGFLASNLATGDRLLSQDQADPRTLTAHEPFDALVRRI
jgi:hypothetical protein